MKTKPILGALIVGCLAMLCMLNPARAVANESLSREYMELLNAYRSSGDPDCGGGMPPVAALSVNEKVIEAAKLHAQGDNQSLVKVGLGEMKSFFLNFPGGIKPIAMLSMVKSHICSSLLDAGLMYIGVVESNGNVWIALAGEFSPGGAGSLLSGSPATAPVAPKKEVETEIDPTLPVLQLKSEPVSDTPWGRHFRIGVAVEGTPFGSVQDFAAGPADFRNVYGSQRHFFFLPFQNAEAAVLWQDRSNDSIRLTMLDGELQLKGQKELESESDDILVAAAVDEAGMIYYLTVERGASSGRGLRTMLYKADPTGRSIASSKLDSSSALLDIWNYEDERGIDNVSDMRVRGGKVCVILSRRMHKSDDGLNHQGGIAFTIDSSTLKLADFFGQTSGHSFGNFLVASRFGGFAALDLGDNYPRGLNLHRIKSSMGSRVVYTFKTEHGTESQSPAGVRYPRYETINSRGREFYQWSNDNRTYTEAGGVVETNEGYLVLFASETPSLDNSLVGGMHSAPRNLGAVHVTRNFLQVADGKENIAPEIMLWKGEEGSGEFYDFGGRKHLQKNSGVRWFTSYDSKGENASRPRIVRMGADRYFAFWEKWNASRYLSSRALEMNGQGAVIRGPVELDGLRVERQGDMFFWRGHIVTVRGNRADETLELDLIEVR